MFFDKIENYSIDNEYKTKLKYAITLIGISILIYSIMDIIEGIIFLRNVDSIF